MRTAARTDANHAEIRDALRRIGCVVIETHQLKNAFDLLVFYRGCTYIVEVKDGNKVPSKRKLTDGEQRCKDSLESVGVTYHIVESVDQAIKLVTT